MPQYSEPGHEIICGTIGMGKSFLVAKKIILSFEANRPCCYIDPKGDTYQSLLAFFAYSPEGQRLWQQYKHRILFVNPVSKSDRIVGFNAIDPVGQFSHATPDLIALVANSLVSHIRRQSGFEMAEANRMQNVMSAAIGLLVEGGKGAYSMAEIPFLFVPTYSNTDNKRKLNTYNSFTHQLLFNPEISHYGVRSFWLNQWPTWTPDARREWVQSTEGRIFQYLFDTRALMTMCTTKNATLDFRKVVDDGYWLFVNLPYPLMTDTLSTLLGNMIITKLFYTCMQRPQGSRDYRIILDEARFFNTGPLEMILETSRAYNLWLTLVVQSLDQMCRMVDGRTDERLKETAINLCRYFSVFHDIQDGPTLAQIMFPLTGQVVIGQRRSGDWEYLPVMAEKAEHERRFQMLDKRNVFLFDKLGDQPPKVYRTPDVNIPHIERAALDHFEAEHLQVIGRPAAEIEREINERQQRIHALLDTSSVELPPRNLPIRDFGGL